MASIRNKNEKAAKRLLKSGHATMLDILTASYGEWPPKGLDINPDIPHDQKVDFKPLLANLKESKAYKEKGFLKRRWAELKEINKTFGRGSLVSEERHIWINKLQCCILPRLFGRSDLNGTMGHEATHILQGDHYWRAADIFGDQAGWIWADQDDVASNMIMRHISDENYKLPGKGLLRKVFRRSSESAKQKRFSYLKEGIEVQARLHEIMMDGYQRWGKMPQNTVELWGALASSGMKPPPEIKKQLKSLSKEPAASVFTKKRLSYSEAGHDIQVVNKALLTTARDMFWHTTLPALYSDLIEMYGDRLGRERFGLGVNGKGQIQEAAFGNPATAKSGLVSL